MFVLLLSNINPQESDPTLFTSESSDVLLENTFTWKMTYYNVKEEKLRMGAK